MRSREEGVDADRNDQAALNLGTDATGSDGALRKFGEDILPVLLLLSFVVRNDGVTALVFDLLNQNFDRRTDLEFTDIDELMCWDNTFGFTADIDDDLVLANFGDDSLYYVTFDVEGEVRLREEFFHDGTWHVIKRVVDGCSKAARTRVCPV